MAETGPIPDTATCHVCAASVAWLWSPRLNGWAMYERVSADGFTVRSHRCQPPRGEFSYRGSEEPSVPPEVAS